MRLTTSALVLAAIAPASFALAESPTPEALREAVKAAFESRSVEAWTANVETTSLSKNDTLILEQTLTRIFAAKPTVESIGLGELPDGFDPVLVGGGRKYTLTLKPVGVINLKFRTGPKSVSEIALPYGKVGNGFKLGTLHGEKLDWKGPEDRAFFVNVKHTGDASDITILVKYNASGVDLEKRVGGATPNLTIPAQYVDSVEVIRKGDAGETSFEILRAGTGDANDRAPVFTSAKLAKPGTLSFKRVAPGGAAPAAPAAK